tara:strand:- start:489 stop:1037 length:549 start_codon:yes stop_codon:yes gene_type:complete
MNFIKTEIEDVIICEPKILKDSRGYFFESFRKDKLDNFLGFKTNFIQENQSFSKKNVLRGMHYQKAPFEQTKLVSVLQGTIIDAVIDLRKNSKTFGKHIKIELSEKNKKQLFIPKGFAHGFLVKSEFAIVSYKVDNVYSQEHEAGIIFNDNVLQINWEVDFKSVIISDKDLCLPNFDQSKVF